MLKYLLFTFMLLLASPAQEAYTRTGQPQCSAMTQKGAKCKNKAQEGSKYCHVHQKIPAKDRCKAITQKGTQCSREAKTEGYCTQHYKR